MSVAISVVNIFVCSGDEFAVVIFPEEDCSLGIVHESWLNEDHDKTLWPNEKNPNKRRRLTVQGAAPTEAWIEVKCIVKAWAAFMERILCTLNAIKLTQQAHSEFFAILMKQATDDCVDEGSLPALPFMTTADLLEYEEELESNAKAKLRMVEPSKKHGEDDDDEDSNESDNNNSSGSYSKDCGAPSSTSPSLPPLPHD
ncbi:hypothetical protein HPB48_000026 [Haemaphysalis longicornis]|uniref:Uncharacterized protein n=1 Tax=Haemaphysalis longicornis TaxID=44386 RepID=A0A9J6GTS4_HAELO|nr:hypothetical protein HPB48_000026 [Haemaphysalis longicornis]